MTPPSRISRCSSVSPSVKYSTAELVSAMDTHREGPEKGEGGLGLGGVLHGDNS